MIAKTIPVTLLLLMGTVSLSGCSWYGQDAEGHYGLRRVVVQRDYAGYKEIQALSEYSAYLKQLPSQSREGELADMKTAFGQEPTALNRFKLAMVHASFERDSAALNEALSLLGDSSFKDNETAALWQFLAAQMRDQLQQQLALLQQIDALAAERDQLAAKLETSATTATTAAKELKEVKAQLAKATDQLNQLKSIEKSIMERDKTEEVVKQ